MSPGEADWRDRGERHSVPISLGDLHVRIDLEGGSAEGRVWDVSEQGLCLLMRGHLQVRVKMIYTLQVRDSFSSQYERFEVQARWSRPDGVATFVGLKFTEIADLKQTLFATYIPVNPWLRARDLRGFG